MPLRAILPPKFDGVVYAYPRVNFTPDRIQLPELPGVAVKIDGYTQPCDGSMWAIESPAVCLGSFVAVHVINFSAETRELELRLIGRVRTAAPAAFRGRIDNSDVSSLREGRR